MTSVSREGTKTITSFVCPVAGAGGKTSVVRATVRAAHHSTILDSRFTLFPPRRTGKRLSGLPGLPGLLSLPAHFTCYVEGDKVDGFSPDYRRSASGTNARGVAPYSGRGVGSGGRGTAPWHGRTSR